MSEWSTAIPPHPGEELKKRLTQKGWNQSVLAEIIGRPPRVINEIVSGKRGIAPETARELAAAFGNSPADWMKLETDYQLARTKPASDRISRNVALRERFPVRDMIKRGWIKASADNDVLEAQLLTFFDIGAVDEVPHLCHAAKKHPKSYQNGAPSPAQLGWIYRVRQLARSIAAPKFSTQKLRAALPRLHGLLSAPEEARHVPRILAETGVRFILVESLPSAKIDGVCLWLGKDSPVVGMSLSRDRIDSFWFCLRHELEHVLNYDGLEDGVAIDVDLSDSRFGADVIPEHEVLANTAALDFCVPQDKLHSFLIRKKPFYYEKDVLAFAAVHRLHPGLVVGQIQARLDRHDWLTKHLAKIRNIILPGAIADGWGQTVPISSGV